MYLHQNCLATFSLSKNKNFLRNISYTPPLWRDLVRILTMKLWHTSSFLFERTDFKNVIFEKIHWPPSEVAEVAEVKRPRNSKWWKFQMKTHLKQMKSKFWPRRPRKWPWRPRGSRKGLSEFFQKIHSLNQGKALRKMSYSSAFSSNFGNYQFLTLWPRGHQESVKNW
jgi:hypothetical protein